MKIKELNNVYDFDVRFNIASLLKDIGSKSLVCVTRKSFKIVTKDLLHLFHNLLKTLSCPLF